KHKRERLMVNSSSVYQKAGEMSYPHALDVIEKTQGTLKGFYQEYSLLEVGDAFDTTLFKIARDLVRLAEEKPKANGERLKEYRDSALSSLELALFSPAPIYPELEQAKLKASLTFLGERLGGEHPL